MLGRLKCFSMSMPCVFTHASSMPMKKPNIPTPIASCHTFTANTAPSRETTMSAALQRQSRPDPKRRRAQALPRSAANPHRPMDRMIRPTSASSAPTWALRAGMRERRMA